MSEWIKARTNLHQDPIVVKQAAALGRTAYEIAYAWLVVWGWARTHTADGFVSDVDHATIDAIAGIPGFAQHAGRWLEFASEGVTFPCWDRHNSNGARERAQTNERKAASRTSRHGDVTLVSRSCPENVTVERDKNGTRREEKRKENTTTTTNSGIARAESPQQDEKAGGGGGGGEKNLGREDELQAVAQAMPSYISAAQRMKLARHALAFATSFDGAASLDVVGYLDSLAKQTSPEARPGSFVNMLKQGGESISRADFAKWLADKPRREWLRWLVDTPEGRRHWAEVYTAKVRATYPNEGLAMQEYVKTRIAMDSQQAKEGAA
jgi:hypothetical protein